MHPMQIQNHSIDSLALSLWFCLAAEGFISVICPLMCNTIKAVILINW